jgi:acyl-CoA thioester hydrolase
MMEHRLTAKVYLEDTDAFGIVYHANYLKYCERARTEMLDVAGHPLGEMQKQNCMFVVFEMKLQFKKPARLHDNLEVRSKAERGSDYRVTFTQEVFRLGEEKPLFRAESIIVAIETDGHLRPLPDGLLED